MEKPLRDFWIVVPIHHSEKDGNQYIILPIIPSMQNPQHTHKNAQKVLKASNLAYTMLSV